MNKISLLDNVRQPTATAKGLPNEHYVNPQTFQEEGKALLFHNWSGIAFGKDVPNLGDAKPVSFLNIPLLIVRDYDGRVQVYYNVCRHRGMKLVDKAQNLGKIIRCPYHSWCYDLDGKLRSTPHVGGPGQNIHEDIRRDELGLFPVRSYVWHDVIFVNVEGNAPEFLEAHADLVNRWSEFAQPIYFGGEESAFDLCLKTNWKLAIENYCESYHLPWVHPGLNSYSRLEDHYHIECKGQYSGQGSLVYQQVMDEEERKFPDFEKLSQKWDKGSEYIALFPNVLLGVHRDHCFAIILEPLNIEETIEHIVLYYATEKAATSSAYKPLRQKNAKLWKEVFEEDIFVVEGMQKGRHCPDFDGGKFSPVMDSPTHLFHDWVAEKMAHFRSP